MDVPRVGDRHDVRIAGRGVDDVDIDELVVIARALEADDGIQADDEQRRRNRCQPEDSAGLWPSCDLHNEYLGHALLFCTYNIHYGIGADGKYDMPRIA